MSADTKTNPKPTSTTGLKPRGATKPKPTTYPAVAWGYNNRGGLGVGSVARQLRPVPVFGLPAHTVDLQGGADFTVALTSNGEVWTWGGNDHGQLGDGATATLQFTPQRLNLPAIASISVGQHHVLAVTAKGHVYAWGRNNDGQLGDGTRTDRSTPVKVAEIGRGAQIATGSACSLVISPTGVVSIWGRQIPGSTVAGTSIDASRPRQLITSTPVRAAQVDAGLKHTVALTSDGQLRSYGVDSAGRRVPEQLHLHPSWGQVTAISAGDLHTVALTDRGTVLTWGNNYYGQLGLRNRTRQAQPTQVRMPNGAGRVVQVVAAGYFTLARTDTHRVYAWGHGELGQAGNGTKAEYFDRPQQVELPDGTKLASIHAGNNHALALL
jgi:alpha-tubulin suppressor-like RCC1 family protein